MPLRYKMTIWLILFSRDMLLFWFLLDYFQIKIINYCCVKKTEHHLYFKNLANSVHPTIKATYHAQPLTLVWTICVPIKKLSKFHKSFDPLKFEYSFYWNQLESVLSLEFFYWSEFWKLICKSILLNLQLYKKPLVNLRANF
jgi:hypothetical protein